MEPRGRFQWSISAQNVTHYYLTHVPPTGSGTTFSPSGKVGGAGNTDGTNAWSTDVPDSYTLPGNAPNGIYSLYLWVADVEKTIQSGSTRSGNLFVLDTLPPPVPTISTKPAKKSIGGAGFSQIVSRDASGGKVTFTYCVGGSCTQYVPTLDSKLWGPNFNVITNVGESYSVTVKAEDALGHFSTTTYTWVRVAACNLAGEYEVTADKACLQVAANSGKYSPASDKTLKELCNGCPCRYQA